MQDKNDAQSQELQPERPRRLWLSALILAGIVLLVALLLLPAVRTARPAAYKSQCQNNLKLIALALFNYVDAYHALPPAHTVDPEGRPLHSWRTLILPYTEYHDLYKKIDLSKPWDDAANAEAYKAIVPVFHCPSASCPMDHTTYLASVGSNACFDPTTPRSLDQITDGLANTLMLIEVAPAQAVHWMSPIDADEQVVLGVGRSSALAHEGGMNAAFCDGSVRYFSRDLADDLRRALISINGNDNQVLRRE